MSSSTLPSSPTLSEKQRGKQRATAISIAEDVAGDGMDQDSHGGGIPTDERPVLSWAFSDCDVDTLVILIAHMLNRLIEHNDQVPVTATSITRFHSRAPPQITVIDYLRRVVKYTHLEKIPLLSLLAYIDLTCRCLPDFTLSSLTVHRFLIAGVCAGSKAQCDVFCTNAYYAKVGGIRTNELNGLEREFLRVTEWGLCCHADLLQNYYTYLIPAHGGYQQAPAPEIDPFHALIPPNPGPGPSGPASTESSSGRTRSASDASSSRRPSVVSRARSTTSSGELSPRSGSLTAVSPTGLGQGEGVGLPEMTGGIPIPSSGAHGVGASASEMDRRRGRPTIIRGLASSIDSNRDIEMASTSSSPPASLRSKTSLQTPISVSPSDPTVASPRLSTGHAHAQAHAHSQSSNDNRLKSLVGGMFRKTTLTTAPEPTQEVQAPVTPKVRSRTERSVDSLGSVAEEEGRRKRLA